MILEIAITVPPTFRTVKNLSILTHLALFKGEGGSSERLLTIAGVTLTDFLKICVDFLFGNYKIRLVRSGYSEIFKSFLKMTFLKFVCFELLYLNSGQVSSSQGSFYCIESGFTKTM